MKNQETKLHLKYSTHDEAPRYVLHDEVLMQACGNPAFRQTKTIQSSLKGKYIAYFAGSSASNRGRTNDVNSEPKLKLMSRCSILADSTFLHYFSNFIKNFRIIDRGRN